MKETIQKIKHDRVIYNMRYMIQSFKFIDFSVSSFALCTDNNVFGYYNKSTKTLTFNQLEFIRTCGISNCGVEEYIIKQCIYELLIEMLPKISTNIPIDYVNFHI